jgi:hypothetical protein
VRVNLNASEKKISCPCWVSNPNLLIVVVTGHILVTSAELSSSVKNLMENISKFKVV